MPLRESSLRIRRKRNYIRKNCNIQTRTKENSDWSRHRRQKDTLGTGKRDISILDENQDFALEVSNEGIRPPYGEITITKKILENDIIWAHGNPVFRFVVNGTDRKGKAHSYENYVEFRQENYEKQGDYAVLSCTIAKVPFGSYTISEKETLRYKFQGITANTPNVQITDREGTAVLDSINETAAVTFTNLKTRYDGYSHTDVVRNIIPVA